MVGMVYTDHRLMKAILKTANPMVGPGIWEGNEE